MSSLNANHNEKASSLNDSARLQTAGGADGSSAHGGRPDGDRSFTQVSTRRKRAGLSLLIDLILLIVIVGLVAGAWFGYRALREVYAPAWETREIVYCVEIEGVSPEIVKYGPDGRPTFVNNAIWSSPTTDADRIGTVTDVRTVLVAWQDNGHSVAGKNTLTLYLTVEASARYREGQGYLMGNTRILAGTESVFRMQGLTSTGRVISLHEKGEAGESLYAEESTAETPVEIETNPAAQG